MSIFGANIHLLNKFLKHFSSCFSKKQMAMFILVIYALFKDYKRNSLDAMAKATHTDYQKFQFPIFMRTRLFFRFKMGYPGLQTHTIGNHSKAKNYRFHKSLSSWKRGTGFLPSMTQGVQNHTQKRLKYDY